MTLIFFQWKLRFSIFQICKRGAKRGARGRPILVWVLVKKLENEENHRFFQRKYVVRWPPFWPPFSRFGKYKTSAFTGKKIKVIACLDQILAHFEIWGKIVFFENLRRRCWKSRFSTAAILKIGIFGFHWHSHSNRAKNWLEKAIMLIFFFSENWDAILIILKKGGQGKSYFTLKDSTWKSLFST